MNRYPLSLYLLPFILLLIIIVFIKSSSDIGIGKKPLLKEYKPSEAEKAEEKEKSELPFESRIPIYPNSEKAALEKGAKVSEAAFFTTTDPIDTVKEWYVNKLGGYNKINLIDVVTKDGLRVITISLPDPPKELVEIKERFKGARDLLITITTVSFYTRNQPRPLDIEQFKKEQENDSAKKESPVKSQKDQNSGDDSNE